MFPDFLNKPEKRKFLFVQHLENQSLLNDDKEAMMHTPGLSSFLFYKTIDELIADFIVFGLQEDMEIQVEGPIVQLIYKGMTHAEILFTYYFEQSLKYCIFKECFFEQLVSIYDFAERHYFSHNPVYKEFKLLKKILLQYGIKITKDFQLVGDEWAIREFLFIFFLSSKETIPTLFPAATREKVKSFGSLFDDPAVHCAPDARMTVKLSLILHIITTRFKNGHHLASARPKGRMVPVSPALLNKITQWVHSINPLQETHLCQIEAEGIAQFMIAEGLIDGAFFAAAGRPEIAEMNQHFFDHLLECFSIGTEDLAKIEQELYHIHYMFISFHPSEHWHYSEAAIDYLIEDYPEFDAFCKSYITSTLHLDMACPSSQYLFHHYLSLLVSVVILEEIVAPIKICLDFSYGEKYNRIIAQHMKHAIDTPYICNEVYVWIRRSFFQIS